MLVWSTGTNTLGRTTQKKQKHISAVNNAVILYNCERGDIGCRTAGMTYLECNPNVFKLRSAGNASVMLKWL